jgi:hypothetical protein
MSKSTLMRIAGMVWFVVGLGLMTLGIKFLLAVMNTPSLALASPHFSFVKNFPHKEVQQVIFWILLVSLLVGYFKGRVALKRSADRQVQRIALLKEVGLKDMYSKGYYLLMLGMMGMGLIMKVLPITLEVRGAVDVAIGSALIQGSVHFFKAARLPFTCQVKN